jgi:hypothetical protein
MSEEEYSQLKRKAVTGRISYYRGRVERSCTVNRTTAD